MTNWARSTMNWHNYPKDFLWIESNSELRARLIGSIIIGDRGSACWAISVINSALDSLQSEGIHHWTCHVLFNFYFITAPSRIPPFVCPYASGHFHLSRKKTLEKKRQLRRSLATAASEIESWGRAGGEVRQGVGVVGFENPISTQISSEIAKQSVCWCAYATILYYLIHIRV